MPFISLITSMAESSKLHMLLQIGGILFYVQVICISILWGNIKWKSGEGFAIRTEMYCSGVEYSTFVEDRPDQPNPRTVLVHWSLSDSEKRKGLWEGLSEKELLDHDIQITETPPFQPLDVKRKPEGVEPLTDLSSYGKMTFAEIENRFDSLILMTHLTCLKQQRMGNEGDGGWDVCLSDIYTPKSGGLVYSVGIANDFSFDDAISETFNVTVHSFDPSIGQPDHQHGARVFFHPIALAGTDGDNVYTDKTSLTIGGIMELLGHKDAVLEYLKFDIEAWEFEVLQQIIRTGVLNQVKQMAFELHMTKFHEVGGSGLYITTYEALLELERQGFRKFFTHQNPNSVFVNPRTGRESKGCCFEIYYINLRFLAHRISTNESLKRA